MQTIRSQIVAMMPQHIGILLISHIAFRLSRDKSALQMFASLAWVLQGFAFATIIIMILQYPFDFVFHNLFSLFLLIIVGGIYGYITMLLPENGHSDINSKRQNIFYCGFRGWKYIWLF